MKYCKGKMKEELIVPNSKAYPFYLLHNELSRMVLQQELNAKYPESRQAIYE